MRKIDPIKLNDFKFEIGRMLHLIEHGTEHIELRPGLEDTPDRVINSWTKLYSGYDQQIDNILTVFNSDGYNEMVICKDIEFYSTCEHHMLPFYGKAHVGYIPNDKIVGLSKIPRIVDMFARRLQIQERLTTQIAGALFDNLEPIGVAVVMEGYHLCMMSRGVQKQNSAMVTSTMLGAFKEQPETRAEFMRLIK